jgi:hypothetical protein
VWWKTAMRGVIGRRCCDRRGITVWWSLFWMGGPSIMIFIRIVGRWNGSRRRRGIWMIIMLLIPMMWRMVGMVMKLSTVVVCRSRVLVRNSARALLGNKRSMFFTSCVGVHSLWWMNVLQVRICGWLNKTTRLMLRSSIVRDQVKLLMS